MRKKISSFLVIMLMVSTLFSTVFTERVFAGVEAAPDTSSMYKQIKDVYKKADAIHRRIHPGDTTFYNECGTHVYCSLVAVGIIAENETSVWNGNQWYANMPAQNTKAGYKVIKKGGTNALTDLINEYGTTLSNVVVGYTNSNPAGHALFIDAIIDGKVYFSDSITPTSNNDGLHGYEPFVDGKPLVSSVDDFINNYKNWGYTMQGVIYFTKNETPAFTPAVIAEGIYNLRNSGNGLYLNVAERGIGSAWYTSKTGDSDGVNIDTAAKSGKPQQEFDVYKYNSAYALRAMMSAAKRVVNVDSGSSSAASNNVVLWERTNHPTQLWLFEKKGDAYIIHPSDNPKLALTAQNDGNVNLAASTGAANQIWYLDLPAPVVETTQPPVISQPPVTSQSDQILQAELVGNEKQAIGIKLNWVPNQNGLGYRIYRSTTPGERGISISDFPIVGSEYVDVNIDSNKDYYYNMCSVLAETSFDPKTGTLTSEKLSEASNEVYIHTPEVVTQIEKKRNFILMQIGKDTMQINEKALEIDPGRSTTPAILNGRALVPIRAIIEAMGGTVGWEDATQKITLEANGHKVEMQLGEMEINADGNKLGIDVAPTTLNGRTMLPVRFVAENIGCEIEWIGSTQQIVIVFFN